MCGIFFSLCRRGFLSPGAEAAQLLRNRGPDSIGTRRALLVPADAGATAALHATFISTVLSLRGSALAEQPLFDQPSESVLCWNGEAWSMHGEPVSGNDSRRVFRALLEACMPGPHLARPTERRVVNVLSSIRGPYAFVFYDARNNRLYYGRDCLGRRSLLKKHTSGDELILSSVCDDATGEDWNEVEANGIYAVNLPALVGEGLPSPTHIPHRRHRDEPDQLSFHIPFPTMNPTIPLGSYACPVLEVVNELGASLRSSLALRVQGIREATNLSDSYSAIHEPRIAILFSGGLDCTLLARLTHELLPRGQTVDLLNVAFENPRIHAKLGPDDSPYELCPDRITGRSSHIELIRVCPGRTWRFVEANVPYSQTLAHRTKVMTLMHPHNTEMDLSISYALYFASKGSGLVRTPDGTSEPYVSPAHVLLSGLGADELFGGYQRHAVAFSRQGYKGLVDELELDFNRLGKRNLGRDDRIISDSGKEVRFPYLDEDFIALALRLPVTSKCDFGNPQLDDSNDPARSLEPGKRVLRMLAWELNMRVVAAEKKRAIQFGARTAKMETSKTKGTHVLS